MRMHIYISILEKLDEIAVDKDGVVMLDSTQRLPESHRHFSHVMCMYPLHLLNYDTEENKRIYQNTLLHLEQLGTGWWIGFSFAMSAQLYAMAHNGNAAYEKLRMFAKGFVADNGFHLNGDFKNYGYSQWHYRPFTLESLFGYCDALQEMLLQEHQGYLDVFPAIPQDWAQFNVSFKNFFHYVRYSIPCFHPSLVFSTKFSLWSQIPFFILLEFSCSGFCSLELLLIK